MPRLLLVDDNPSIHKIAETLLASTDVELVCTESAAQALDLIGRGESFDAALLDTHMLGMDGWQLLDELRRHPATARIPVAMMAGVLDEVDPKRIQAAPIQAFLKKPVELRDLSLRVHQLLEASVQEPETPKPPREQSPFATMPGTRLEDLELDPAPAAIEPSSLVPTPIEEDDDLLVLTEEDLFPEEIAVELAEASGEAPSTFEAEPLELEELDLNGLRAMTTEEAAGMKPIAEDLEAPAPSILPAVPQLVTSELPDLGTEPEPSPAHDALVAEAPVPESSITEDLLVLEDWAAPPPEPPADLGPTLVLEDAAAGALAVDEEEVDLELDADQIPPPLPAAALPPPRAPSPFLLPPPLPAGAPVPPPLPTMAAAAAHEASPTPQALPEPGPVMPPTPSSIPPLPSAGPDAAALALAIAQDPALLEALAKAVAAHLGDKVLREIAWEVMPDLAERMRRP